ncbi:hypothetical protein HN51_042626 [Arachis hypogaea]|nr:LysM domain receptor-like kinase [Arachis hypogaea]
MDALLPKTNHWARTASVISLRLFCGCSSGLWNYLVSYVIRDGDSIEAVNAIDNPDNVIVGCLFYIPLNSIPGEPYHHYWNNDTPSVPVPSPSFDNFSASNQVKDDEEGKISHKLHIHGNPSFFCGSGGYMCGKSTLDEERDDGESSNLQITVSKPSSNQPHIGFSTIHITDGSVYYGLFRDQEVAIKRMTTAHTKESMIELKAMCRVHHAILVEFIGYAASHDNEIFLILNMLKWVYSEAIYKGHLPLSWIIRVQIALDAARGLEYIHEHAKAHDVHQDITTSNILLAASFRGKISDFGFAKLIAKGNVGEAATRKFATSYGYLAPEFLGDGLAMTESDVFAFGVVLFEIISGKEAVIQTEGVATNNPDRRSIGICSLVFRTSLAVVSMQMVSILRSTSSLRDNIGPSMMNLYPYDNVFKMAMLAKQCVEDDPILQL